MIGQRLTYRFLLIAGGFLGLGQPAFAGSFDSGSGGSDGPFNAQEHIEIDLLLTAVASGAASAANVPRVSMKSIESRSEVEQRYVEQLERARGSLRAGDDQHALSAVEEAHLMECRDSEAFLVRGLVFRARDDDDTAIADFREALALDPGYAAASAGCSAQTTWEGTY